MTGVISYGAYIPYHRISREEFHRAWGGFAIALLLAYLVQTGVAAFVPLPYFDAFLVLALLCGLLGMKHDARIAAWMDAIPGEERAVGLAVVDPPIVRAAVAHALGAGPAGAWRVDVAPLTLSVLTGHGGRWNLRSLGPASG